MTKFCQNCGVQLEPGEKFCHQCGAQVTDAVEEVNTVCPKCGTAVEAGEKFCPSCGTALSGHDQPREDDVHEEPTSTYAAPAAQALNKQSVVEDFKFKFMNYNGRLNRLPYFVRNIIVGIVGSILGGIFSVLGDKFVLFYIVALAIYIFMLVCSISLGVRRCHDLNRPGWWMVGIFIPLVNFVLSLYLLFARGTVGANEYGDDPLEFEN